MREKTFLRFLQHLYYSYPMHVVDRVFKYLFVAWEFYHPCSHLRLLVNRSLLISKHIADRIYWHEARLTGGRDKEKEEDEAMREVIEGVTMTVVLVMARIEVNPLLVVNNKRKQSEEYTN